MRLVVPFTSTSDSSISFHRRLLTAFFEPSFSLLLLKNLYWWKYPLFAVPSASDFILPSTTLTLTPVNLWSKSEICEWIFRKEQCYCEADTRTDGQEFPSFYGTRRFVTTSQEPYIFFLSWTVESSLSPRIFFKYSFLILSFQQRMFPPNYYHKVFLQHFA